MVRTESTAGAEQRLRGILPYIAPCDLVRLQQLLPEYIRLTEGSTTDPDKTFFFQSTVLTSWSNQPLEHRADSEQRLRDALASVPKRELNFLRQLVPQYQQPPTPDDAATPASTSYPLPTPLPTRCRIRSRSPTLVDRSFVHRCSVQCSASGCSAPCGKAIFALGAPSHTRHYCQDHR